ncbi:sensor histidine kinase [Lunatimonas salinarum]|uniref:sensor histidine kinase n=1 Tax=Lunatimonas salinarum TaxID=1774590 RepID=UPI001AE0BBB8|nr:histidine kinase [Lunatimonas salinarum]
MQHHKLQFPQIERWVLIFVFVTIILSNVLSSSNLNPWSDLSLYFAKILIPMVLFASVSLMHFWLIPKYRQTRKKTKPILLSLLLFVLSLALTAMIGAGFDISERIFLPAYFGAIVTYFGYLAFAYMADKIFLSPQPKDYSLYNSIRIGIIYLFVLLFLLQFKELVAPFIVFCYAVAIPSIGFTIVYHFLLIYRNRRSGNLREARIYHWILPVGIILLSAAISATFNLGPDMVFFGIGLALIVVVIVIPLSTMVFDKYETYLGKIHTLTAKADQSTANLSFLRSQINPHFLFNALNTLYGTALQEGSEHTATGIQKLGDMMRFMLHENNQEKIAVEREKEYLINYVDLQELRFNGQENTSITFNRSTDTCKGQIAPMLLIPFIENAFKHGISLQHKSWVNISLRCLAGSVHLDVTNSMHRSKSDDPEHKSSGIGLQNVRQRLQLLYPGKHELIIRENDLEFFVHLSIQL